MSKTMHCNVILTFNSSGGIYDDFQEIFNLNLQIHEKETSCIDFLNRELFPRILKKCKSLNRDHRDLIKISTASDWDLFYNQTQLLSLDSLGHSCKWFFGADRPEMDFWENDLANRLGFGTNAYYYQKFKKHLFAQADGTLAGILSKPFPLLIRELCIESAYYNCGWSFEDTSEDLLNNLDQELTATSYQTYDSLVEALNASSRCTQLKDFANYNLAKFICNPNLSQLSIDPISVQDVIEHMYDLKSYFETGNS